MVVRMHALCPGVPMHLFQAFAQALRRPNPAPCELGIGACCLRSEQPSARQATDCHAQTAKCALQQAAPAITGSHVATLQPASNTSQAGKKQVQSLVDARLRSLHRMIVHLMPSPAVPCRR